MHRPQRYPRRYLLAMTAHRRLLSCSIALFLGACGPCGGSADSPEPAPEGDGSGAVAAQEASGDSARADDAPEAEPGDAPVALVSGEPVLTASELSATLDDIVQRYERIDGRPPTTPEWRDDRRRRIVQDAVQDALIRAHVDEQGIEIADARLEEALRTELRHVYEEPELFERFLLSRGVTREEFVAEKRYELAVDDVLGGPEALAPSEDDIRAFYDSNRENWREDDRVLVSAITIRVRPNAPDEQVSEARGRIDALRERVTGGEDFADVASEHSEASERFQGGELGWIVRGRRAQFAENGVEDVLFDADVGTITEPLRTQLGWQVFWIRDRREAGVRDFDEVRDVLADPILRRNRQRARQELVNQLMETASVEYRRENWDLEAEEAAE